ncbi:tricarballylate utilization protein B [Thiorhodovibrio winogradskyi]|uniref:Tricarballylate utilization protein B n=1 Tax=Thiorhodovibrio winogradskyi TaxID=77007 RepID=A0ABZ0S3Z9_9GAMM|nr:tricarballylate utilization 4Fe-4S protein TcuB [Thiorhodovibrio winogradskyi]
MLPVPDPLPTDPRAVTEEARRMLAICNICGYCNGFCPVFDAARERPALRAGDLAYLAHLCHACRNCLDACQYAPPHAFGVNVPRTLERLRWRNYADFAWPRALAALFRARVGARRPGVGPTPFLLPLLPPALAMLLPMLLGLWWLPWSRLMQGALAPGDFYRILPFSVMVGLGLLTLGWALLSMGISLINFWRAISLGRPPARLTWSGLRAALWDIASLRHLDGGGPGCTDSHTPLAPMRRWLHQLLVLGFLLCLAATLVAAVWHHGLGRAAPYAAASLPVVLGLLGGLLMLPAGLGLWWLRRRTNPLTLAPEMQGGETSATLWLLAVVLSGLALLAGRATPAMGLLLLAHLGAVYGFFLLLPASKFVHAGYRLLAVSRLRLEPKALARTDPT